MSDWWHVAQVSAPVLGSAAMCLGLRRYARAVLWNVFLKRVGVDAAERRAIGVRVARLDLGIDENLPPRPGRGSNAGTAAPQRPCRVVRARGLRM